MFKKLFKWKDTNVQTTIIHPTPPEDVIKDISEPVLAIVEAMKDAERWMCCKKYMASSIGFRRCKIVVKDKHTSNEFAVAVEEYFRGETKYHVDYEWATKDEKHLLITTILKLYEEVEYQKQQAANKAERERLMGDYCK